MNLAQWVEAWESGGLDDLGSIMERAGWWDWFCPKSALVRRTQVMGAKLQQLLRVAPNLAGYDVALKNCCPLYGRLYDRVSLLSGDQLVWVIIPSRGHNCAMGRAEVFGQEDDFNMPVVSGKWRDVLAFFRDYGVEVVS